MACTHCNHANSDHTAAGCKATVGDGGFCPCVEPPTPRTLAQWADDWPYLVRPWAPGCSYPPQIDPATAAIFVTPDSDNAAPGVRAEAFWLSDVLVSAVSGGSIWFRRRAL
jgi:hypothetical protein